MCYLLPQPQSKIPPGTQKKKIYKENDRAGLNRSQSLLLYDQRFEDKHRLPLQGLHY